MMRNADPASPAGQKPPTAEFCFHYLLLTSRPEHGRATNFEARNPRPNSIEASIQLDG
jgi:hypothetical protein